MVDQTCLYFVNFHLVLLYCVTIMKFWKWLLKIAFCFLPSLSWWWDSKKKNTESYAKEKVRYNFLKNAKISLLPCFWAHKYNFMNNFIVGFMYEDDVTQVDLSSGNVYYKLVFSDKKNQIPKTFPMWVLCPWNVDKILRFCCWYGFWHFIHFERNVPDAWLLPKQ